MGKHFCCQSQVQQMFHLRTNPQIHHKKIQEPIESGQAHRMAEVGKDLWRWSSPRPPKPIAKVPREDEGSALQQPIHSLLPATHRVGTTLVHGTAPAQELHLTCSATSNCNGLKPAEKQREQQPVNTGLKSPQT